MRATKDFGILLIFTRRPNLKAQEKNKEEHTKNQKRKHKIFTRRPKLKAQETKKNTKIKSKNSEKKA
jgi:hypothetical protein